MYRQFGKHLFELLLVSGEGHVMPEKAEVARGEEFTKIDSQIQHFSKQEIKIRFVKDLLWQSTAMSTPTLTHNYPSVSAVLMQLHRFAAAVVVVA